jgi:hypothetical protein
MPSHPAPADVGDAVAGSVEKLRTLTPVLVALATLFVAVMQAVNGLPADQIAETLVVGWLLSTPVAALLLWPTPSVLPVDGDGEREPEDPLARLKARYADGEIDAAEFERRVETMLAADAAVRDGDGSLRDRDDSLRDGDAAVRGESVESGASPETAVERD